MLEYKNGLAKYFCILLDLQTWVSKVKKIFNVNENLLKHSNSTRKSKSAKDCFKIFFPLEEHFKEI